METNPVAEAIKASLVAAGLSVGDHRAPAGVPPYTVLYMQPGGRVEGTAANPAEFYDFRFRLTSVGQVPAQARWQHDRAEAALQAHPVTVSGRTIQRVQRIDASPGVQRDDAVDPPLYYATALYGAWNFD